MRRDLDPCPLIPENCSTPTGANSRRFLPQIVTLYGCISAPIAAYGANNKLI